MKAAHFDVPDDLVVDDIARECNTLHLRTEWERLFAELELEVVGQVIAEIDSMKEEWRFAWPNYIL